MSQIKKLDQLIKKIIAEETSKQVSEQDTIFVTQDGTAKTATSAQKNRIKNIQRKPGATVNYVKAGTSTTDTSSTMEEGEEEQIEYTESPKAKDIMQELSSVMEQLSGLAESNLDEKYKKNVAKVQKYLETAKAYLDNIEEYQKVLDTKNVELSNKQASKTSKVLERSLSRLIKDEGVVSKIMKKIPTNKIVELKSAYKKELDEQKLAKALLNLSLKEGYITEAEGLITESDASRRVASDKMSALMAKMDKIKSPASEKKEKISLEDEQEFIRKSERGLSQEEKAILVKKRKAEKSYLTDQEYKELSPEKKAELVATRKKELDPNLSDKEKELPYEEKLKAIEKKGKYDKDYSEEELDKEQEEKISQNLKKYGHNRVLQQIVPTGTDFYLLKKPYYKWDDKDIEAYKRVIKSYGDSIRSKIEDIPASTKKIESLSSILSAKDAEILAKVVKDSYTGGKIDPTELSKAKELTDDIRSYVAQNYFTKAKDPAKVGGSAETLNPFDDEIRKYLRSTDIKDQELEAYLGAYLDTISTAESETHKESYRGVFTYLEFLTSLLYGGDSPDKKLLYKDDKYLNKKEKKEKKAAQERDKKISDLVQNIIKDVVKVAAESNENIDDYLLKKIEALMKKTQSAGYDNSAIVKKLKQAVPTNKIQADVSTSAGGARLSAALIKKYIPDAEVKELLAQYDKAGVPNDEMAKKLTAIATKRKLEQEKKK